MLVVFLAQGSQFIETVKAYILAFYFSSESNFYHILSQVPSTRSLQCAIFRVRLAVFMRFLSSARVCSSSSSSGSSVVSQPAQNLATGVRRNRRADTIITPVCIESLTASVVPLHVAHFSPHQPTYTYTRTQTS